MLIQIATDAPHPRNDSKSEETSRRGGLGLISLWIYPWGGELNGDFVQYKKKDTVSSEETVSFVFV